VKASERHRLKEDKYADTVLKIAAWARQHLTPILAVAAIMLGIIAVILWTVHSRRSAEEAADELLSQIQLRAQAALAAKPEAQADAVREVQSSVNDLVNAFPDSRAAPVALLRAAEVLRAAGESPQAVERYERALKAAGQQTGLVSLARRGLAEALEDTGKIKEAIEQYRFFAMDSASPEAAHANWDIGRCYETLGDLATAKEFYQNAVNRGGDSAWAKLARFRLDSLARGAPASSVKPWSPAAPPSAGKPVSPAAGAGTSAGPSAPPAPAAPAAPAATSPPEAPGNPSPPAAPATQK
jgi:predicted negative regulator of RcsB-dependent stress response